MEKYRSISVGEPMEIFDLQPLEKNPMLSKAKVKIAYSGMNRNGSFISKEVMELMVRRSLALTPVVGYYIKDKKDFGDHNTHLEVDENYDLITIRGTKVYGVVPERPVVYWQTFADEDGELRDYIVSDVYLWTERFPEVKRVLEGNNNHSMEIDEGSVIGKWDEKANNGLGAFIIEEANFSALCILGADIDPCFEGASFSSDFALKKEQLEYQKEMGNFMSKLEFALKHEFDESRIGLNVVDVDTDQEVEDIKEAVDRLDEAAETEASPETQEAIDSAIDTLLQVEVELDIEDQIVPITEEAKKVIDGMPGDMKDILSNSSYEKAPTINTPFKEEETEMAKTPEELLEEQKNKEQQAVEQAPVVQEEVPVEVEPKTEEVVVEVQDDAEGRKSAEEKRKEVELAKYDDEELLEMLIARMETADSMKERIAQLVQGAEEVMEENPDLQGDSEEEEVEEDFAAKEEDDKEEVDVEVKVEDKEDAPEAEEEDPKKKKNIQSYELELADMAKQMFALQQENEALKQENELLNEFKLNVDNQEKEEVLSTFALLDDEFKTQIRSEFSLLSKEDIEAKCALAYFRKGLMGAGQNTQASEAVISYNLEDEKDSLPGWIKAVKSATK